MKFASHAIILFDSQCILCNRSVQKIIQIDKQAKFLFASLQSDFGKRLIKASALPADTVILLLHNKIYIQSNAVIMSLYTLGGKWKYLAFTLQIFPQAIRDRLYQLIAQKRHQWFGKKNICKIAHIDLRNRLIE